MLSTLKTWFTNSLIALSLVLLLVQTCPGVPYWLSWRPQVLADATGTWQVKWNMFSPDPDRQNHRIRALIEYHDGEVVHWQSPEWPDQSNWERFVGHRRSGYINAVQLPQFKEALPGLAHWLARTHRHNDTQLGRPKLVQIFVDYYDIPDPRLRGWNWRPIEGYARYEHKTLIHQESFP
jgi:hypothetical protein